MNKFIKLSTLNKLQAQTRQTINNINHLKPNHLTSAQQALIQAYNSTHTLYSRHQNSSIQQPEMFSTQPGLNSFESRSIYQADTDQLENLQQIDHSIRILKIKYEKELLNILQDMKGETLDEKISRVLDCDRSTFEQIIKK